jgi:hypothetical protein
MIEKIDRLESLHYELMELKTGGDCETSRSSRRDV